MKIEQNQVLSIEPFGMLDGRPVNLIQLKGGLNMATHFDSKGTESVIGAASHRAILAYTLEQRFSNFQPIMMKSESGLRLNADSHSHFLTDDLRKSGHDIYSIQNGKEVDFFITKLNVQINQVKASVENDTLHIQALKNTPSYFINSLSGAVSEKALLMGLKSVKVE